MDYIRFAIDNPVKVTVGVLLLLLFGFIGLFAIPVQLVPNIDHPVIRVTTNWTGRSPEEIEKEIVEEQEDKLKAVSGLRKMTAEASPGKAEIKLEFHVGSNMDRTFDEVSDKLREVPEYPDDVDEPVIAVADTASENAIAWMVLTSEDPDFDIEQLRDTTEDRIKPFLERVDGISQINVYGGRDREVHIQIDPTRLAERSITFSQLYETLKLENVNVSAGDLREGYRDVRIRTVGRYDNLEAIRQTIVADTEGGSVRVSDLGDVVLTLAKRRAFVRSRGQPAIALNAIRASGANVLEVMRDLRQRIERVNKQILPRIRPDLHLTQVYDETVYIDDAIELVQWNLVIGGGLAILGLILFLRRVGPILIVSLAIPISVIGTFVVMTAFGRNINVVSLAGLAFAVGMVVDNSIVVLENIDRHLAMGKRPREAAYDATKEVWGAILASTLTTVAVFVPVLVLEEEAGQLFRDIAIAICAAVSLSLIVSVTVIPCASARWLGVRGQATRTGGTGQLFGLVSALSLMTQWWSDLLYRLMHPGATSVLARLGIVGLLIAGAIGAVVLLIPPTSYLPDGNRNLVFGVMMTPPAYHIEHNKMIAERVEKTVKPYWQAKDMGDTERLPPVSLMTAPGQFVSVQCPPIDNYFFVSFGGTIFMGASSKHSEIIKPLASLLTTAMNEVPGAIGFAFQPSIFGRGVSGGNAVDVEVMGADINQVRQSAEALYGPIAQRYGFHRVRPDPINFNQAGPELQIKVDRIMSAALGVDVSKLGLAISALIDGVIVGDYSIEGESIDILLTRHPKFVLTPDTIGMVPVAYQDRTGQNGIVPLSAIIQAIHSDAPQEIRRIEERRAVSFTVRLPSNVALEQAAKDIMSIVAELRENKQIDPDVDVLPSGTADKLLKLRSALLGHWEGWTWSSFQSLGQSRVFLALLVIFLLMAALFESFLYPFVIMFTVPLATVGGFMGLAIVHELTKADPAVSTQQFDVLTMLGFVILIGVVVNNAILVIHQTLNFMQRAEDANQATPQAMTYREAIRESIRTRTRPIFMTSMTSIFGMAPLVVMPGAGSELYRGLGSVMIGGLIMATVFTLVVIPLLFSLVMDVASWASRP